MLKRPTESESQPAENRPNAEPLRRALGTFNRSNWGDRRTLNEDGFHEILTY